MGEWYHLITNNEWMTIARNIEQVGDNWTSWTVWSGAIFRGNVWIDDDPASCGSNSVLDWNTDWDNCIITEWIHDGRNKRMHILSNGSQIWDLSWNVWHHVNGANTLDGSDFDTMKWKWCDNGQTSSTWFSWSWNDWQEECKFTNEYT